MRTALKGSHFVFLFVVTVAGVLTALLKLEITVMLSLAFIASSFRVDEENLLFETDPHSFF